MALLEVRNLRTEFALRDTSVAAVDDVSFYVNEGETLGLVGESGCGKTTTGLSLMQLLPSNGKVAAGSILFDGEDLATYSDKQMQAVRGNTVALIPQDPLTSLNPVKRIGDQIGEGFRIHTGASKDAANKRAIEVLKMVEMPNPEERLRQYPHELSGGLRQRAIIAMALVCKPKLLIADEPTTALDVTIQAQILDILDHLRRDLGMAMILITHDMGVIAGRTDRVGVMYGGKIIEQAETAELFATMRHPYTQALLGAVPNLAEAGDRSTRLASIPGIPPNLRELGVGCSFAKRCQFATDVCRTTIPSLDVYGDNGHSYACFHPVDGPKPVEVIVRSGLLAPVEAREHAAFVEISNLVKNFPVRSSGVFRRSVGSVSAVADVNFAVGRGETFGLVGESGCGKTTIGRLVVGLETPTSGSVTFPDVDLSVGKGKKSNAQAVARQRQMMFQDPYSSLDPRMRVGSIISEPLDIQEIGNKKERTERVRGLLAEVGLPPDAMERFPHEFSGGQRQRIGLARALALEPQLIVADEPVSALDVSIQAQILNLLQDLQEKHALSYILISHDLAVVKHASDRIGVMYLGKLVEVGPSEEIFTNPAHHYTRALLDAVPVPDVARARARLNQVVSGEIPSAINPPSGCRFRTRCPAATDRCAAEEPMMEDVATGHTVACHFPLRKVAASMSSAAQQ